MHSNDEFLYTGTYGGLYYSSDNGVTWNVNDSLSQNGIISLLVSGDSVFAGEYGGIFLTTDNGTNWTALNNGLPFMIAVTAMADLKGSILAGTWDLGMLLSKDRGLTWQPVEDGIQFGSINSFMKKGNYIYAATDAGIYYRDIDNLLTGIDDGSPVPAGYSLEQNYPNPFNPSTTINYTIGENGFVTLKVYDLLGREVAVLVNEEKGIGNYTTEFSGAGLSSGIYFYRLQAGSFTKTRKFLLLK